MALVPIKLPPGMYRNGTPYDAKNRWAGGNLVRWHDGSLRPIGGWRQLATASGSVDLKAIIPDPATETIRDARQWRDNAGGTTRVVFSNKGAYYITPDGTVTDITPAGFVGGGNQPVGSTGYGTGPYGRFEYGVARPADSGAIAPVYRWSHSLWGEDLLACPAAPTAGGMLYEFDSSAPGQMVPVANAPADISGVLVTDERIVMAIGSASEPRRVRWSSREDRTDWTPTVSNEAGGDNLQGNGKLLSINSVLNTVLILSESDAHAGRYIGAPYIYGFERVGDNCGPLNGAAVVVADRFAIWPSRRSFFMYDGTVQRVACDVMDFVQADFNEDALSKMHGVHVADFSEVWWFYQGTGDTEVNSYVVFDYEANHWQVGKLDRTVAFGGEGTQPLLMIDAAAELYEHEIGTLVVDGAYAETGPLELGQGEVNMAVRRIFPDTQTYGDVSFTLYGRQMPTAPEHSYGPYAYDNPVSTRAMGREIRLRTDGINRWEVGNTMRFDIAGRGTGRR